MEDENKEVPASVEQEEAVTPEENNGEEETIEEVKEREAKALKKAEDQEKRAKIAEEKLKELKNHAPKTESKKDELTQTDLVALIRSDVADDDIDYVKRFANLENISIADALKHDELKAVLAVRKEKRATAQATFTGKTPRSTGKVSDEALLSNLSKGEVPEPGSSQAEALFWARRGGKK